MACEVSHQAVPASIALAARSSPEGGAAGQRTVDAADRDPCATATPTVAVPTWQAASAGRPAHSLLTDAVGASPTGDLPLSHLSIERLSLTYTLQHASWPLPGSAERTSSDCATATAGSGNAREGMRRTR